MPQISDQELARMKQSLEELTTLNRIANAINVSMSIDQITKTIVDHCCRRVQADQGAIFLLEEEDQNIERFKTFVRETSAVDGQIPFHLSQSLQGWMIKNRSILLTNDPDGDDRIRGSAYSKIGLRNILAAPLLSRSGLMGVLVLFNKAGEAGFDDRDKRFLGIVGTQVSKVIENAQLFEKEMRLIEIEKEMDVAKSIQAAFLPKSNVVTDVLEAIGFNESAKTVGGDYYDLIELDPSRVFFSLGDVSGKGLPAALLTGNAQAVMRSQLYRGGTPDLRELADCLNQLICHFTQPGQYITALFGVLDGAARKLRYINAGHLPPIVVRRDGIAEMPAEADLVIGVVPGVPFTVLELGVTSGETVYIYSDGITEAFDENETQFGDERLVEVLVESRQKTAQETCQELLEALGRHRGAAAQSDDITLLALRMK